MRPYLQEFMDERFAKAQGFLSGNGRELREEMGMAFEKQVQLALQEQSTLQVSDRMVLPAWPDLQEVIREQASLAWSLGYAVGCSGFFPQQAEHDNT